LPKQSTVLPNNTLIAAAVAAGVVLLQAAREAAKRLAVEKGIADIDRARPIPDPQDTGLIKGIKAVREQQQKQQEAQQQQQQQASEQKQQEQQ
jgi:hypothetical protein